MFFLGDSCKKTEKGFSTYFEFHVGSSLVLNTFDKLVYFC